jgi:hypothetical protein
MMLFAARIRPGVLLLAAALAWGAPLVARAGDAKTTADDKCVAQCDEESDKCMLGAGKDTSKQKQCDSSYDECLRKCN